MNTAKLVVERLVVEFAVFALVSNCWELQVHVYCGHQNAEPVSISV